MSRFPSAEHLLSWACICPRNDESAGKRRSNRMRKGGAWLKTTLVQCAWAAVKTVAASILTAIYHMLKDGTMYKDLGRDHFDRRSTDRQKKRLIKRLTDLGYTVTIKPLAA
jgi:transposase